MTECGKAAQYFKAIQLHASTLACSCRGDITTLRIAFNCFQPVSLLTRTHIWKQALFREAGLLLSSKNMLLLICVFPHTLHALYVYCIRDGWMNVSLIGFECLLSGCTDCLAQRWRHVGKCLLYFWWEEFAQKHFVVSNVALRLAPSLPRHDVTGFCVANPRHETRLPSFFVRQNEHDLRWNSRSQDFY